MGISNKQYETIMRTYEEKQRRSQQELEDRTAEIYDALPGYEDLDRQVAVVSISQARKSLAGDTKASSELPALLDDLSRRKAALLQKAGYPADYLTPRYECSACKDTGYIGTEKCSCLKQAISRLRYEQSNIETLLLTENFDHLSYLYYQGDDLTAFRRTVNTCHEFVDTFDSDYRNLLFYGTVGTGKSFLSSCIAAELLKAGKTVLYFSSGQFFDMLARETFDKKEKEEYSTKADDILNCDLLIIDDLGTEFTNNFTLTQLFSCLNSRHLAKRSTVISTNLTPEEIRDRYSDRVFSRIMNQFTLCKLTGPDIRVYRKTQMK